MNEDRENLLRLQKRISASLRKQAADKQAKLLREADLFDLLPVELMALDFRYVYSAVDYEGAVFHSHTAETAMDSLNQLDLMDLVILHGYLRDIRPAAMPLPAYCVAGDHKTITVPIRSKALLEFKATGAEQTSKITAWMLLPDKRKLSIHVELWEDPIRLVRTEGKSTEQRYEWSCRYESDFAAKTWPKAELFYSGVLGSSGTYLAYMPAEETEKGDRDAT